MKAGRRAMRFLALGALLAALAGCGAAPRVGDDMSLTGTLVLKGSEPRPAPVLVRESGEQWELESVAADAARDLQNRRVRARGVVTRAPGAGPLLPALRVTGIEPRDQEPTGATLPR